MTTQEHHRGPTCRHCGNPTATQAAWNEIPEGEGADLCWDSSCCAGKDWVAEVESLRVQLAAATQRAERLEADLAALRAAVAVTPKNVRLLAAGPRCCPYMCPTADPCGYCLANAKINLQAIASRASQRASEMGERR